MRSAAYRIGCAVDLFSRIMPIEDTAVVYRGKVRNGVVVLDGKVDLPDGTEVIVRPANRPAWRKCVGTISEEQAEAMLSAIDEACERVDPESET